MKKQNIQNSNYLQREKNFLTMITSEDTLQVIIGNDDSKTLRLWQDEYYMNEYLNTSKENIKLSKIETIEFLKWIKYNNTEDVNFYIHPVFGQESPSINSSELIDKILEKIESNGDFYDRLRENNLL